MAADTEIQTLGFIIDLKALGAKDIVDQFNLLTKAIRQSGLGSDYLKSVQDELRNKLAHTGKSAKDIAKILKDLKLTTRNEDGGGRKNFADGIVSSFVQLQKVMMTLKATMAMPKRFYAMTEEVSKFNFELGRMAINANLSMQSLTGLGAAAGKFGGSSKEIAGAQQSWDSMISAWVNRGQAPTQMLAELSKYGIQLNPSGTRDDFLKELGRVLKYRSKGERGDIKSILNGVVAESEFDEIAVDGYEKFAERRAKIASSGLGQHTEEAATNSRELNAATSELKAEWDDIKTQMFNELAPLLIEIVKHVKEFLETIRKSPDAVRQLLQGLILVGGVISTLSFAKLIQQVMRLIGMLGTAGKAAGALSGIGRMGMGMGGIGQAGLVALTGYAGYEIGKWGAEQIIDKIDEANADPEKNRIEADRIAAETKRKRAEDVQKYKEGKLQFSPRTLRSLANKKRQIEQMNQLPVATASFSSSAVTTNEGDTNNWNFNVSMCGSATEDDGARIYRGFRQAQNGERFVKTGISGVQ